MLLPIVFRFGAFIVRLFVGLVRGALEISTVARGTPLAMVLVLALLVVLLYVLIHRRRARRKADTSKS
jgi:hypothetical protein